MAEHHERGRTTEALSKEAADGSFLLPEVVRALPYSWSYGFIWPPETEQSDETLAYARAVLAACLPPAPLAEPEPPPEPDKFSIREGEKPAWVEIRAVVRNLTDYASCVTRERMAEAEAECARRGLDTTDFTERWTIRISGWIAEQVLYWCGLMVDDVESLRPWAMELAELYAQRGMAAEKAVALLCLTRTVPESREALVRLAADRGLSPELRELASEGLA